MCERAQKLAKNPWHCDNDFMEFIRNVDSFKFRLGYKQIRCDDGELDVMMLE